MPLYRCGSFSAAAVNVAPAADKGRDPATGKFEKLVQLLKKRAASSSLADKPPVHSTTAALNVVALPSAQDRQHLVALHNLHTNHSSNLRATKNSPADADHMRTSHCGGLHAIVGSSTSQFRRHHSYTYGEDDDAEDSHDSREQSGSAIHRRSNGSSRKPPATLTHSSPSTSSATSSSSTDSSRSATRARSASAATLPTITSLAFHAVFGELAIKCSYSEEDDLKGDIALVRLDEDRIDFDRLVEQLESFYGFAKRGLEVEVTYTDKEGDKVRIRDTASLTYACRDWRRQLRKRKNTGRSLRVVAKGKRRQT